jgi:hypothetical protein
MASHWIVSAWIFTRVKQQSNDLDMTKIRCQSEALLRHRENIQSALSGIGSMNRRESPVVSSASIPLDSRLTRVDLPHDPLRFWF